jgi:hypothetical protein
MATLMLMVMMPVIMATLMGVVLIPMLVIVGIMRMGYRLMFMLMFMFLIGMTTHFIFTSFFRYFSPLVSNLINYNHLPSFFQEAVILI